MRADWPDSLALYHAARRARARVMSDMLVTTGRWIAQRSVGFVSFVRLRPSGRCMPQIDVVKLALNRTRSF
jgi:hypothetical protein